MKINFYEEFPNEKNLKKIELINFPTTLIIAVKSWKNFNKIKSKISKKKNLKLIYWPAVKNTYWISPFSNTKDLISFFKKLDNKKEDFLVDLEFPMKNKKMILKNLLKLRKNKKIIRKFLIKNNKHSLLATYPLCTGIGNFLLKIIGLDYDLQIKRKPMFYTSYFRQHKIVFLMKYFLKNLEKIENKNEFVLGLGVIAKGKITTKILTPKQLEEDLTFAKKAGFSEVIIFRLGGLNKNYMKIINKFI